MDAKQLMIGGLNPRVTLEDFKCFSLQQQLQALCWMCLQMVHRAPDRRDLDIPSDADLKADIDAHREAVFKAYHAWLERGALHERQHAYHNGQRLFNVLADVMPVHAELTLKPHQAKGFLSEMETTTSFKPDPLASAIDEIEALGIQTDFGVNSVNTGHCCTSWVTGGDVYAFWMLQISVSSEDQLALIRSKQDEISMILNRVGAQRVEVSAEYWPETMRKLTAEQVPQRWLRWSLLWD